MEKKNLIIIGVKRKVYKNRCNPLYLLFLSISSGNSSPILRNCLVMRVKCLGGVNHIIIWHCSTFPLSYFPTWCPSFKYPSMGPSGLWWRWPGRDTPPLSPSQSGREITPALQRKILIQERTGKISNNPGHHHIILLEYSKVCFGWKVIMINE